MREVWLVALMGFIWSPRPIGSDVVKTKTAAAVTVVPEERRINNDGDIAANNGTWSCDRHLRSADVEVRNPRNHKFVTSNGWSERQRPRPEINVYSRVEELPSPLPAAATTAFYQQQRDSFYQQSRQQQPAVRTSKRIIYYATLPDVIRPPASGYPPQPASGYPPQPASGYPPQPASGYPPQLSSGYPAEPYALSPGPFSADFRQLDSNRNALDGGFQHNRLVPNQNNYNRGGGGGGGSVTTVTSKSVAAYDSRYDEPAEFRDPFYRPNEFTSKFASWAEPFYKSWTSPSWDKEPPVPTYSSNRGGPSSFSWDREPLNRGSGSWDNRGGGSWDNRGSSWDNRGTSWDKELVEVPLQKPNGGNGRSGGGSGGGGGGNDFNSDKYPEVAVVHSGVIDVRGDRQPNALPPQPVAPPPRFMIIDVDPKPYHQQQHQPEPPQQLPSSMRYDERNVNPAHRMQYEPPQKPMRYEAYTPMEPPTRYEQQQPPTPSSVQYEQRYRAPPPSSSSSSSTRYEHHQSQNKQPNGYFETIKNNINTHQFMTSWTEVSTQDDVLPTHTAVSIDINSLDNSTSVQNNTSRIIPSTNTTKTLK